MPIKINDKILSIPPYISTSWTRIAALHMKGGMLAITLVDGDTLLIPKLSQNDIDLIFQYHASYLENEQAVSSKKDLMQSKDIMDDKTEPSIRLAFGNSLEGLGTLMQHNPNQANFPDLPPEVLQKIGAIAKIIEPSEDLIIPKAEPDCNCFHCQIARVINPASTQSVQEEHHEVSEEELQFQQWNIVQTGDQLFSVTNRLDEHEKYNVYLGQPVGCTCGKAGCEHILAVLKS